MWGASAGGEVCGSVARARAGGASLCLGSGWMNGRLHVFYAADRSTLNSVGRCKARQGSTWCMARSSTVSHAWPKSVFPAAAHRQPLGPTPLLCARSLATENLPPTSCTTPRPPPLLPELHGTVSVRRLSSRLLIHMHTLLLTHLYMPHLNFRSTVSGTRGSCHAPSSTNT